MLRNWSLAVLTLAWGVLVATRQDQPWQAAIWSVIFLLVAFLLSPLFFPRSLPAARAQQLSAADDRPIVYWRPGCRYCLRLRIRLGSRARRAHWVNIWSDPAGAAAVRAVTGGDETVPTVVAGGEAVVNPKPDWLRERLSR
ncbi:glutaredoxin domain-containing protein [Micromonospora krabiensis]|uniref:Glutaredoxin n=1 Tax=Micromonospora krabiensis TaxID=307121 RepID=A0A1C3N9B6_9ACTN|nr:glutaredoxin domain-containing protein [Micromonospora krabiensis]SBV29136.1 Glutaredoxin [Micromonospora krabiensis]